MKKWWRQVVHEFELGDHHLLLLQSACSAWDAAEAARLRIEQDGAIWTDAKGNLKPHPACQQEVLNRKLHAQLTRELGLDFQEAAPARAPLLPSYRKQVS